MSHFAQIDASGNVLRVIVADSQEWCERRLGGIWVQTSYSGSTRKNYAGKGYTYDKLRDAFIPPKPSATAVLDEIKCQWIDPVATSQPAANVPVTGGTIKTRE